MDDFTPKFADLTWHPGEIAIQRIAGVADEMAPIAKQVIRGHLIEQHRAFFPKLPFIVAGSVDPRGDVWATVLVGTPGFLKSPDPTRLRVTTMLSRADPTTAGMNDGDAVGLLGIELPTRRRNRLNGRISRLDDFTFDVIVSQSYGNCPQYIRHRQHHFAHDPMCPTDEEPAELTGFDAKTSAMIASAETFFISSYFDHEDGSRHVDASHKGGRPGFVHVGEDGVLTIPDFAGNLYFNTLGNILLNPKCGLVFVDFENGDVLQITGDGEVILDAPEIAAFQGAERLLRVRPRRIVFRPGGLPLRWSSPPAGISEITLLTGTWDQAGAQLRATELGASWRSFRVAKTVDESSVIRSLYLAPTDGAGFAPHKAGQHITVRARLSYSEALTTRSYTLSSAPSDSLYRISVKRDGVMSMFLHTLMVGDVIEVRSPGGQFTIDIDAGRPIVLIGAGVGVTPLIAMLRHAVYEGNRTRQFHPIWFIQAARTKAERAFDCEIDALVSAGDSAMALTRALSDPSGAQVGDFEVAGRVTMDLLSEVTPMDRFDFYICGPGSFTQDIYDDLRANNVPDSQIFTEAFGPGALRRQNISKNRDKVVHVPAQRSVDVTFTASGKHAKWTPQSGTLLEFAEAQGISPDFDCRRGTCSTCSTRVIAGSVAYKNRPSLVLNENEALICRAVPAESNDDDVGLILDL